MRGFGLVTNEMELTLRHYIERRTVWDLGAGNLVHAKTRLQLGAKQVVAIDKNEFRPSLSQGFNIQTIQSRYSDLAPPDIDVAWLSWPSNTTLDGLLGILERSHLVIYLGCNTGGSACGWPGLFKHFRTREVLANHASRQNTMTVYGSSSSLGRPTTSEEWVMCNGQPFVSFEEAEQQARTSRHQR